MTAYYNEIEPYAAQWLKNLISAGLIPAGDVDERSIADVRPGDLDGYAQCHFFAGLGGWSRALRLAGWPDTRPVWTGSCPCQPFSTAGKRRGFADDRHLWPEWHRLIGERRPAIVFGEQVAKAAQWLTLVRSDMEAMGYAVGAVPIEASSVGANHKRDRFWFVAHADGAELWDQSGWRGWPRRQDQAIARDDGEARPVADSDGSRRSPRNGHLPSAGYGHPVAPGSGDVAHAYASGSPERREPQLLAQLAPPLGGGWWASEPDVGRVAHGVSARVAKLRALGNAIVPQAAAEFIKAAID